MSDRGRSPGSGQGPVRAGTGPADGGPGASDAIPAQAPRAENGPAETGAASEQRIAELEDLRLRALADLDNMRKKCASLVSRAEAETRARVALQWLPVVDNLERALAH
ncbi:MAG TPA: nucleotide exchange factor GrpE, partial [Streptosporangiaceae bacterium]|nr:nucleotide exchange factor GrpE [Streptosporangiaceae bacterium]